MLMLELRRSSITSALVAWWILLILDETANYRSSSKWSQISNQYLFMMASLHHQSVPAQHTAFVPNTEQMPQSWVESLHANKNLFQLQHAYAFSDGLLTNTSTSTECTYHLSKDQTCKLVYVDCFQNLCRENVEQFLYVILCSVITPPWSNAKVTSWLKSEQTKTNTQQKT